MSSSRLTNGGEASAKCGRLRSLNAWVFDLDNTLYPSTIGLFRQMDERMRAYIADFLGIDEAAAFALQKEYFRAYGTSLRGLMTHHQLDPAPFLDHVHQIDLSILVADDALNEALAHLPGRKFIYTNASVRHAERVLDRLGIAHHFDDIFDIVAADYRPKPVAEAYRAMVARFGLDPRAAAMVEDLAVNLLPAAALGMTTVWIRNQADHGPLGADGDHVHHVVDDLAVWLRDISATANDRETVSMRSAD
jgi:pyrimidine 5''-nucleotidase